MRKFVPYLPNSNPEEVHGSDDQHGMVNEEGLVDTDIEAGMVTDDEQCLDEDMTSVPPSLQTAVPPRRMQRPPRAWTGPAIGWEPVPQTMPARDDTHNLAQPHEGWEDGEWKESDGEGRPAEAVIGPPAQEN